MFKKKYFKTGLTALAISMAAAYAPAGSAAVSTLAPYAQDFEALNAADPLALGFAGGENFGVFADVWFGAVGTGTFLYSYGVFTAPNGGPGFSAIAGGEGGVAQGTQYMNIYSDYGNADHGNGFNINTNVFQEFTIGTTDIGSTWTFTADYKAPSTCGIAESPSCAPNGLPNFPVNNSTAAAFIKTLDPNNSYATTNDIRFDTTNADPGTWGSFTLSIDLTDPLLDGQLLQFGFNTVATNFQDSGVYYDNINFAVPVPAAVWLFGSGLVGLVGVARRRKQA